MKTGDFDFYLPEELIAQTPLKKRDSPKLLVLDKKTGETTFSVNEQMMMEQLVHLHCMQIFLL